MLPNAVTQCGNTSVCEPLSGPLPRIGAPCTFRLRILRSSESDLDKGVIPGEVWQRGFSEVRSMTDRALCEIHQHLGHFDARTLRRACARLQEATMRRSMLVLSFLLSVSLFAQQPPKIRYQSVPDFLKLAPDMYFGEVAGVALNSKGHVFVFSRGNNTGPAH